MDNDLLTKWLNAAFLTEVEIRDLIQELQDARDEIAEYESTECDVNELTSRKI